MIRVLLADDHAVLRDGLGYLLRTDPEIEVVGSVADGNRAVTTALDLRPDVLVMEISLPGLDGIEVARQICQTTAGVKIIILSLQNNDGNILRALQAGVRGYVLKESAGEEVIQAVHTVAAGGHYFSQSIVELLVQNYIHRVLEDDTERDHNLYEHLSPREKDVLKLVASGKSSAEAGIVLYLSTKTVETYRSRLMHKVGVNDLAGLIRFAVRNDIV